MSNRHSFVVQLDNLKEAADSLDLINLRRAKQYIEDRIKLFSTDSIAKELRNKFPQYGSLIDGIIHICTYSNDFCSVVQPRIIWRSESSDSDSDSEDDSSDEISDDTREYEIQYRFTNKNCVGVENCTLECFLTNRYSSYLVAIPKEHNDLIRFGLDVYQTLINIGY